MEAILEVTVVDAANVPIAGADVRVVGAAAGFTTDETGQATVPVRPGWVHLAATAAARAPRRLKLPVPAGAPTRITITLHEGFPVSGQVVDLLGAPIANARIHAVQVSELGETQDVAAVTDASGAFSIPAAIGMQSFQAFDDEHAPATTPVLDVDRPISGLVIVMKPGAIFAGTVVDAEGAAVAGARVVCDSRGRLDSRSLSKITDAAGAFEFRGLPPTVVVAYATTTTEVSEPMFVVPTAEDRPSLVLKRVDAGVGATVIAGTVVDDTGEPVAGELVHATRHVNFGIPEIKTLERLSTTTDERGTFSFHDLAPGRHRVWPGPAEPQPFHIEDREHMVGALDQAWFTTTATTGDTSVHLERPRRGAIIGKLDSAIDVTVSPEPAHDHDFGVACERGVIDLRDLPTGTFALRISGAGFLEMRIEEVRVEPGVTTDLGTLSVPPGRIVRGIVVDPTGRPIAGARVLVGQFSVYGGLGRYDEPCPARDAARDSTLTDAAGMFSIAVQARSKTSWVLVAGADHPAHGRALPVKVADVDEPPAVTLTLRACGSIAGTVTRNGSPLTDVTVGAGWPELGFGETIDDGTFVVSRLPAGPMILRFTLFDAPSRPHQLLVDVAADAQTDITVDIPVD